MINHFAVAAMSVLTAIALATVVHALIVMVVVGIRRPRAINSGGVLAPVTWFRPLKAGVPDLHAKLLSFMEAVQPGDQILFGVDPDSEAARIVADLSHGHGGFVQVIACRKGAAKNPKVSKLVQLAPAARHELWLIADGESLIDRNFANAFRREWRGADVDVLTAGYRFIGTDHWPQRLDAMSTVLTLWPGLELIRTFGKIRFTLGACTGIRRADVEAIGGWEGLGDELAEDYRLGARLCAMGKSVRLSDAILTLDADGLTGSEYWRHQLRIAVTYRAVRPLGTAGMILTRGVTASLLAAVIYPLPGLILLSVALVSRVALAECIAATRGFSLKNPVSLVLLSDAAETLAWLRAWVTRTVCWGGRVRRISWRGRLKE